MGTQLITFDLTAVNGQRTVIEHQFSLDCVKGQHILIQDRG